MSANGDWLLEEGIVEHLVAQLFVDCRGTPAVGMIVLEARACQRTLAICFGVEMTVTVDALNCGRHASNTSGRDRAVLGWLKKTSREDMLIVDKIDRRNRVLGRLEGLAYNPLMTS